MHSLSVSVLRAAMSGGLRNAGVADPGAGGVHGCGLMGRMSRVSWRWGSGGDAVEPRNPYPYTREGMTECRWGWTQRLSN